MEQELASKFNKNTKAIIVNTPNNPLGKVFTQKELEYIGNLCQKWDVLCIMDEVYEWMTYEPYQHVRMGNFLMQSSFGQLCLNMYWWCLFLFCFVFVFSLFTWDVGKNSYHRISRQDF